MQPNGKCAALSTVFGLSWEKNLCCTKGCDTSHVSGSSDPVGINRRTIAWLVRAVNPIITQKMRGKSCQRTELVGGSGDPDAINERFAKNNAKTRGR